MLSPLSSYELYKYEHGLTAAQQRAADVHAGQVAAELKNLGRCLGGAFSRLRRAVPARKTGTVPAGTGRGRRATAPARVPSGVR